MYDYQLKHELYNPKTKVFYYFLIKHIQIQVKKEKKLSNFLYKKDFKQFDTSLLKYAKPDFNRNTDGDLLILEGRFPHLQWPYYKSQLHGTRAYML